MVTEVPQNSPAPGIMLKFFAFPAGDFVSIRIQQVKWLQLKCLRLLWRLEVAVHVLHTGGSASDSGHILGTRIAGRKT
jgi:hypothetical protein